MSEMMELCIICSVCPQTKGMKCTIDREETILIFDILFGLLSHSIFFSSKNAFHTNKQCTVLKNPMSKKQRMLFYQKSNSATHDFP